MSDLISTWPRIKYPSYLLPPTSISHITQENVKNLMIGIDEAGRGCVLGSLIYCAAFWLQDDDEVLRKIGFQDSKQINENERLRSVSLSL